MIGSLALAFLLQGAPPAAAPHHQVVPLAADGALKTRGAPYEVVSGDPRTPGAPFVIRIYNYDNQVVAPHWHPTDEHVVVLKGSWLVGGGDVFERSALRELKTGDYVFFPKEMRHFALSKGDTVIQVHGVGPFKINFVDTWLFLSRPSDSARFGFKAGDRVRSRSRGEGHVREGVFSEKNAVKQYVIERDDGTAFWEFEDELHPVAR